MKRSLTLFGVILLVQSLLSAPVDVEDSVTVEEPVNVNPELRGILDSILSAVVTPILNGLGIVGQGVVDPSMILSSAINGIAGTGGNLVNNPLGNSPLVNNPLVNVPLGLLNPVHNYQRDEEILDAVKALVDEINSESPNVPADAIQNDEMDLLDAFLNNDLKNVEDEEEIPLLLVVV